MIGPVDESEAVAFGPAKDATGASVFECGLCGLRFTHGDLVCSSCALGAGCDLVKCPRCGYQFPRGSRLLQWVRRLVGTAAPRKDLRLPRGSLDRIAPGEVVRIVSVAPDSRERLRLANFGVLPGAIVGIEQDRPVMIVRIGETTLAIERELASQIRVSSPGEPDAESAAAAE